jgi:hypothetical protein
MDHSEVSCADCLAVGVAADADCRGAVRPRRWSVSHQSVTITGTGFANGVGVDDRGAVVHATSYVSPSELRVTFSVPTTRAPGTTSLRVTNPDGGSSTLQDVCVVRGRSDAGPATTIAGRRTKAAERVHLIGSGFVDGLSLTGPAGVTFTDLVVTPTEDHRDDDGRGHHRGSRGQKVHRDQPGAVPGWGTVLGDPAHGAARRPPHLRLTVSRSVAKS